MMRISLGKTVLLILLYLPVISMAQKNYELSGVVENKESKEKIVLVALQILELNRWTTSDMNGKFTFENVPEGKYTLQASCLGYEKYEIQLTLQTNIYDFRINLEVTSLGLDEVIIVAKENTGLTTSSKIEGVALEHVQATNLADVMQLIPGQITLNPDMSQTNQISIRDINTQKDPADNDALGTAIIIDGTPVDNDANMQTLNTTRGGTSQTYSTAGQGVDLRQISTDNIESIEVIRGIPSVKYGDLTTGAVLVKTKAGETPLKAKVKADPNIKQAAISKGFLLAGNNLGAANIDFDFTHSYDDLRKPAESYKRITGQLSYSNTLFKQNKPLSINTKFGYFHTIDDEKNDPDQLQLEKERERESGLDLKIYGKWAIQKWWLGNISYNFSGSFKKQNYYNYRLNSGSSTPVPSSYSSGEFVADILPSSYYSELTIDGKPYNYFATVNMDSRWKIGRLSSKMIYGFDWRISGNKGKGRQYDLTRPPLGSISTRPRAFNDIPANKKLALFVEEELVIPIGETRLTTQFGLRYNNMLPKGIFSTNGYTFIEPRINTAYNIIKLNREKTVQHLTFHFGYGKTSKTPAMLFLYPDKAYFDRISFNYYPELIVITSKVFDGISNPDLKPMTNDKLELGADISILGVKLMVTGFKEKIRNGFNWSRKYYTMDYKQWHTLGPGYFPVFENGEIIYNDNGAPQILGFESKTRFEYFDIPENNYSVDKKGIEYVANFGQLEQIKTNFSIDGAYFFIKRTSSVIPFSDYIYSTYQGGDYPFSSILPGNKGLISQRFNSNFKTTTHIPDLKMIFTFTLQTIWMDKSQSFWEDNKGNPLAYSIGENGERLYGQKNDGKKLNIDPIGFFDMNMQYHDWQNDYSFVAPYSTMVTKYDSDYFDQESYPVSWQINLKLTKELGHYANLSFFANNLLNQRPLVKLSKTGIYQRMNQPAYFGAELILKL
ncbi:carboxypeptidase-like regulatory domain-containing protein [Maribellus sp. YY47]|uniref:TonB-dependent receptor n=1 Tax=Maribellus sp. YY47 TaxID=2929486 RepID=UPI002001B80F|nr:carboxypeptidase-like regulatory domain-containing protein [Maribellus sp. YY47]MCK3683398.1 carboxypeptidase-like regulatory domain-containing protein [Maribellus sp. YY47]